MNNDFITIGKVLKPRGLLGEVKVQILTNKPEIFTGINKSQIIFSKSGKTINPAPQINKVSVQSGFAYMTFKGINDAETADKLRNAEVRIPRGLFVIADDEILTDDLIGMEVFGSGHKKLGTIKSVEAVGSGEVINCEYAVIPNDGRREFSFPYEDAFVIETNIKNRCLVIRTEMLEEETID